MKDDIFKIHVTIGGFRMPLIIARKDEEIYRSAEKKVNNLIEKYHKKYNQRPTEEILTIVAFHLSTAYYKGSFSKDTAPIVEKIMALDKELDEILSKKE